MNFSLFSEVIIPIDLCNNCNWSVLLNWTSFYVAYRPNPWPICNFNCNPEVPIESNIGLLCIMKYNKGLYLVIFIMLGYIMYMTFFFFNTYIYISIYIYTPVYIYRPYVIVVFWGKLSRPIWYHLWNELQKQHINSKHLFLLFKTSDIRNSHIWSIEPTLLVFTLQNAQERMFITLIHLSCTRQVFVPDMNNLLAHSNMKPS